MTIPPTLIKNLNFISQVQPGSRIHVTKEGELEAIGSLFHWNDEVGTTRKVEEVVKQTLQVLSSKNLDERARANLLSMVGHSVDGIELLAFGCNDAKNYLNLMEGRGRLLGYLESAGIQRVKETVLEDDWVAPDLAPAAASYLTTTGIGPNLLGKVYALGASLVEWLGSEKSSVSSSLPLGLQKLMQPGVQLSDSSNEIFMAWLGSAKKIKFHQETSFRAYRDILRVKPENVEKRLARVVKEYKAHPENPVVIPIVLEKGALFEAGHIITVIIKNGVLYCYDPKGEASSHHPLQDQAGTLRDRLEMIGKMFNVDFVQENLTPQQLNIHQCGRHSIMYCYEVLTGKIPLSGMENRAITQQEVTEFGQKIGRELIGYWNENTEFRKSQGYD